MKKIALLLTSQPNCGGEHQYAMQIAECLKDNDKKAFELIALCTNQFWKRWCRENGVKYNSINLPLLIEQEVELGIKHPYISKMYTNLSMTIGKWIRKNKIDIFFCTQQGILLPNLPVKTIRPVHDLMHRYEAAFSEIKSSYNERELLYKSVAKFSSIILVDSKLGRIQFDECYREYKNKGMKVIVLPFTAPQYILEEKEEFIDTPHKYVFYPAQFWQHKNHINLLKAIRLLKTDIPNINVVLCGSEKNSLGSIKKYIEKENLKDNVTILGFVSNEEITYLYKHAVALIMPSYFGPTNIPPLEAMALGCPVAVSDKYAMPEQIGNAGLTFNPDSPHEIAECIKKLWLDEDLRNLLIARGLEKSKKWGVNEFNERLLSILNLC